MHEDANQRSLWVSGNLEAGERRLTLGIVILLAALLYLASAGRIGLLCTSGFIIALEVGSGHVLQRQDAVPFVMEIDKTENDVNQEEEYVLLDLDAVCGQVDIPPDEPYVLSGLDTLNPVLTIGDNLKLIGEYQETIGTCLIFSEAEKKLSVQEETRSSDANLFKGASMVELNQGTSKQVSPVTSLQKILKFRLLSEADEQDMMEKPPDGAVQGECNE